MLRTILILATLSLLCTVSYAQTKIGDDVLNIDSASILELQSTSRGFLPSRMTTSQRDAQTSWDQAHIIFNTTDNCLQIYSGIVWECLQQGTPIDTSIYKQNGTLQSDRTVIMNGSDLTFDGSRDIIITDDGRLGIGDPSPDALLDVEGGTVRLSDYGSGVNSGQRTFLLGVDIDGDVITVDTSSVGTDDQIIDALFIRNDTLFISLEDDGVSDLFVNLASYLDDINIYQTDDTLTANRTVHMDGKYLQFSNSDGRTRTRIENDGDLSQTGRNITHTLTDTSQDVQLELSAQGSFSTIGNTSDHSLNIIQDGTTALSVRNNDYIRMNNYGNGNRTGTPSYIIGVDTDGDLLDVDLSDVSDTDWLALDGSSADNILDTIYTFGNVGINTSSPDASLHVVDQPDTYAGPWAIIEGGGGVRANTALRLYDKGTAANNENILEFAHQVAGNPVPLATIRSSTESNLHADGADLIIETSSDDTGTLNTNQLYLNNDGNVGIGTSTPDEELHINGDMRLDGAFEDKDGDAGASGNVLTSTVSGTDWVAASSVGTDNQTIDTFSINGSNQLQLSLENDGEAAQTVDLSGYLDDQTVAITGAGINVVTGTYPNFTITGTEVDGSISNETITNFSYTASSGRLRITESGSNYDAFVSVMTGATGGANGVRGLVPNADAGEQTYLLTGAGTWVDPSTLSGINIYSDNGTLDANRTVGLSTFDLIFDGTTDVIIESGGDVGIGTTSPDAKLHISGGNMRLDNAFEDKDGDAGSSGDVLTSTVTGTDWVAASSVGTDNQTIDTFSINGSNQLQLSLENDGEAAQTVDLSGYLDDQTVAITGAGINAVTGTYPNFTITGTEVDGSTTNETITNFTYTASSGRLRITESGSNYDAFVSVMTGATGGANGVPGLVPNADAGEQTYLLTGGGTWVDPTTLSGTNIYTDNGTLDANRTVGLSTFDLIFDGTTDVIIESGGDVGIGTTSPDAKLHVSGGASSVELLIEADTDNVTETDQPKLTFRQDGGAIEGHLGFTDGDNILRLSNESNNNLEFQTNATTRVTIQGDGDVGIGTNTPDEELHIAGDMRLDGAFEDKDGDAGSSGDVLTSTVTGTDWVAASSVGTDNQTIDTFSINGSNQLQLSLENDGEAAQTVDLSGYLDDQTVAITGAGINAVTGTYPNFTITGTEVDGSTSNETITNFTYTASSGRLRITESGSNYDAIVPLMTGATGGANGIRGLVPNADAGEQTYLLTGAGTWVDPSTISGTNIYTGNGSLGGNRTVTLNSRSLTFNGAGTGDVIIEADGDVGIGTTSPGARLEVAGGSVIFDEYGTGMHADTSADYILAANSDGDVVELNTAKNTRWFYPPAVVIDASDLDTAATLDLHADYVSQFSTPLVSSDGASGKVPYYDETELEFYITDYDETILDNVSIDADGVMTYDIIAVPFDNYTVINVVFVIK